MKNKFLSRINNLKFLFLTLLVLLLGSVILGFHLSDKWGDLFINITASFIIIIFTIFMIDWLFEEQKEKKLKDAHNIAKEDMSLLVNMLVSYVGTPLVGSIISDLDPEKGIKDQADILIKDLLSKILSINLREKLKTLTTSDWEHLQINMIFIKSDLTEKTSLYSDLLPPEILGKLLKVRRIFMSFYSLFGLLPELFTKDKDNWPPNKGGMQNSEAIRLVLLEQFTSYLKSYFYATKELINILEDWKK